MSNEGQWLEGTNGPWVGLVDYILGITHEIWESRQVDRINDYYSPDTLIHTLGGQVRGSAAIIRNTHETLAAFPDRLLLGEDVIWSRLGPGSFLSSHRILSPMTNTGPSAFGPATGRRVQVRTVADCQVDNGVITREWLVRDNYSLVRQLGLDPLLIAGTAAKREVPPDHALWLKAAREQATTASLPPATGHCERGGEAAFAASVLHNAWVRGDAATTERQYAAYAVLHDSLPVASGRHAIAAQQATLRGALADVALSIDHCCVRPQDDQRCNLAARWLLAARQTGTLWNLPPTGAPLVILGITHWHVVDGRIAAEWSIYDRIAVLEQLLRGR